jgi:membrane protease YdiL (CAAX protease family)
MATDFDPYRILQVSTTAGQDEIEQAYERMAAIVRDGGMDEESRRAVDAAYLILREPDQRRAYDERRAEAIARGAVMPAADAESLLYPERRSGRAAWGIGDMLKAIGVIVAGLFISGIPLVLLAEAVAGDRAIEDDPNAWAIVLAANFVVEALFVGTAYWFGVRKYGLNLGALGLRRPHRGGVLLVFGLVIGTFGTIMAWGLLLSAFGIQPDTDLPEQTYTDWRPVLALIVLSVLMAPIGEEIFFRGFVFGGLRGRWGGVLAAVGSGFLFSLAHVGNPGYIVVLPGIVGIGILFAWAYSYSGSLAPSIIAHVVFNSVNVIYAILST